ncbi:MAG: DUF6879 family protein [Egibacteraceae bacterium]
MTHQALTGEELDTLFKTCQESAFRLEALQDYTVFSEGDAERRRAFHEGRPIPVSPGKAEDMQFWQEATAAGKRFHRVHVIDLPLTPYLEFELAVYPENVAAGEDVRIADRAQHPGLAELTEDFLLFDGDTDQPVAVLFRYTPDGDLLSWDRSDDPDDIARCRAQRYLALAHSVPLERFRAMVRTE